ncbi:hypothetical protein Back11_18810 [Paenibacillus baekrokdamisoli]|uniref:Uncharacterized protein n=1 Tax=Paenibacillus baekrokdamisoli TaxID=1712516 RepID=A0A3G9IQ86_9BACL|nr:hypothetical protein Back11_18810 [Paenibacillus baekrokdamisoli]
MLYARKLGSRATEMLLFEWSSDSEKGILKDEIVPTLIVRSSTIKRIPEETS